MLTIIQNFELKWPFYVRNYLNFFGSIGGGLTTQVVSMDCLLYDYDIDTVSLYAQTGFLAVLPFIIYVFAGGYLFVNFLATKKSQMIRFVIVVIVVSIFLQPTIIKMLFDNLSCKVLENTKYLSQDMSVLCSSDSHFKWVNLL